MCVKGKLREYIAKIMIKFVEGSLLCANKRFSMVQCISWDIRFGKFRGISVEFLSDKPRYLRLLGSSDKT